ncbi:hypothetical protein B7992_07290 [Fibrobacter sp. UWH1]|nr:hypothetical protein B7992_07290 [Fibrobacter sp. UWH1]
MSQIGKYAINVMVDKSNSEYGWLPTKAIVIYNGMKYAFDMIKYESLLPEMEKKLRTLPSSESACLVGKIELYLREYISPEALEVLKMAFQSIGQRLGFVSAGDAYRALERKVRRMESASKAKDAKLVEKDNALAEKDNALAEKDALIAALQAKLAEMSK